MPLRPEDEQILLLVEGLSDINGRYRDLQRLGPSATEGFFSLMFSALDTTTNQTVALKFFHPNCHDRYRHDSFVREAQLLDYFRGHPNILQLVEGKQTFQVPVTGPNNIRLSIPLDYFTTELAAGSLRHYIYSVDPSPLDSLYLFRDVCKALQRIHAHRIVHRDLKPDNCLLFPGRILKLSDFGTAKNCTEAPLLPSYANPVGDLRYTAFELLCGIDPTEATLRASDLYALGALLFEMFSQTVLAGMLLTNDLQNIITALRSIPNLSKRTEDFARLLPHIFSCWSPPILRQMPGTAPKCIADRLNLLYHALITPDYTRRSTITFEWLFRQVNICILILNNESRYQLWRMKRRMLRGVVVGKTLP